MKELIVIEKELCECCSERRGNAYGYSEKSKIKHLCSDCGSMYENGAIGEVFILIQKRLIKSEIARINKKFKNNYKEYENLRLNMLSIIYKELPLDSYYSRKIAKELGNYSVPKKYNDFINKEIKERRKMVLKEKIKKLNKELKELKELT